MADNIWTDPNIFEETNNVNSVVLNKFLSENMRYLFSRPRDIITLRDIGSFTTTSTTLVAVSTSSLRLSITTQSISDLKFWFEGSFSINSSNYRLIDFDILMDGTTYLSTNTGTPSARGLNSRDTNGAASGVAMSANFEFVFEEVSAGAHFFDLYYATAGNTLTLVTDPTLQFGVIEV